LNKLTKEHGGEKQSSDLKILSGNCHTSGWRLEGRGLRGNAYALTNQERLAGVVTVGSLSLELGES
jgi:hypothetical protein